MKVLIISGAGILAGTHIYNKLIKGMINLKKFKKDSEFPEIVLYNYPFASIGENGHLEEVLAKKELNCILEKFADFDHTIIACNTFHVLDLSLKSLLSLPKFSLNKFNNIEQQKKGLVLCSSYSREKDLFKSKDLFYPDKEINNFIDKIIYENIFSYNQYKKEEFAKLNNYIKTKKISHLIIGCTELSLIDWENLVDIPVIDGSDVIIQNILNKIEGK